MAGPFYLDGNRHKQNPINALLTGTTLLASQPVISSGRWTCSLECELDRKLVDQACSVLRSHNLSGLSCQALDAVSLRLLEGRLPLGKTSHHLLLPQLSNAHGSHQQAHDNDAYIPSIPFS